MAAPFMIDTDVAIDYLRGNPDAVTFIEGLSGSHLLSSISVAELFAGVRDGAERVKLESFVRAFEVVSVEQSIGERGGLIGATMARATPLDWRMLSLPPWPSLAGPCLRP